MASHPVPSAANASFVFFAVALICASAAAQTNFKVLHNFKGPPDADAPWAGVTLDAKGNLYGTTAGGGTGKCGGGCGTVYKLTPQADGDWEETVVHSFQNGDDFVFGGLVGDGQGNLYGTTGGTDILFELTSRGSWRQFTLPEGGSNATLLADGYRHLYGPGGSGVFELTRGVKGWEQRVLYQFQCGTDGCGEVWSVVSDATGNLYGTTKFGGNYPPVCSGSAGCGTAFEMTSEANGKWTEHILHRFAQFKNDGQLPFGGLVMDKQGNLYGTTIEGGSVRNNGLCQVGCGVVFKLSRSANGQWKETILHSFCQAKGCSDGAGPWGTLLFDTAGNLYGISAGGNSACDEGCGLVFRLTPQANGRWQYSVLHRFDGKDGYTAVGGLASDSHGNFYGTTLSGGSHEYGVVYKITP
jgi:uncharacterized repeat protein (TIGR03803 family)